MPDPVKKELVDYYREEYTSLRKEALIANENQMKVYPWAFAALTGLLAYIFKDNLITVLYIVPLIGLAIVFRWVQDLRSAVIYSNYLMTLEGKINKELGVQNNLEQGVCYWQHYWTKNDGGDNFWTQLFERPQTWSIICMLGIPIIFSTVFLVFSDRYILISTLTFGQLYSIVILLLLIILGYNVLRVRGLYVHPLKR